MKSFLSYLTYLFLRALFALVRMLPNSWNYALARGIGTLLYRLDSRHREIARSNLKQAFGSTKSEQDLDALAKKAFQHFVTIAIESILVDRDIRSGRLMEFIQFNCAEEMKRLLARGKGLILLAPHLGNWEMSGLALAASGHPAAVIARPLKNVYLDAYLKKSREATGLRTLPRRGGFHALIPELKNGGVIAILPDQNQRKRPIFVSWFGRVAASDRSAAFLALRLGAPVMTYGLFREGTTFHFRSYGKEVKLPAASGDRDQDLLRYTEEIHRALENLIRERPEQYFWLHDRYRTRPAEEKAQAVGKAEIDYDEESGERAEV